MSAEPHHPPHLASVVRLAEFLAIQPDWSAVVDNACRIVVSDLGAAHSGFVLFDLGHHVGQVVAEYPPTVAALGTSIPIDGIPAEERLIRDKVPIVIPNIAEATTELGPLRDVLLDLGTRSLVVVPVVGGDRVLGSFSLDFADADHEVTSEQLLVCRALAAEIALALAAREARSESEALRCIPNVLGMQLTTEEMIQELVNRAAAEVQATGGGFYRFEPETGRLRLAVDAGRQRFIGITLQVGQGMAGRLVAMAQEDGTRTLVVNAYAQSAYAVPVFPAGEFDSVIEVVVRNAHEILGVLYLDSSERRFYDFDARLVLPFAEAAATVLDFAVRSEQQRRAQVLIEEQLVLSQMADPVERLEVLASRLVRLGPSYCRVWALDAAARMLVVRVRSSGSKTTPMSTTATLWTVDLNTRPEVREVLADGESVLWHAACPRDKGWITALTSEMPGSEGIEAVLLVPVLRDGQPVALFEFGAITGGGFAFSTTTIRNIAELSQLALSAFGDIGPDLARRAQLYTRLDAMCRNLKAERPDDDLRVVGVRLAQELIRADIASLYTNRPSLLELELEVASGQPRHIVRHGEGPVGRAAEEMSVVIEDAGKVDQSWCPPGCPRCPDLAFAVPVRINGTVDCVLYLGKYAAGEEGAALEAEVLEKFGQRLAAAIHTSWLMNPQQRRLNNVQLLFEITRSMHLLDSDRVLHALVTAVTANFGLGFNRATVFLLDPTGNRLQGRMGAGYFARTDQERAWDHALTDLTAYREVLRSADPLPLEAVALWAQQTSISVPDAGIFAEVLRTGEGRIIQRSAYSTLPGVFRERLKPRSEVAVVPLMVHNRTIGVLTVDTPHSAPEKVITSDELEDLLAFASAAATALEHRRLSTGMQESRERLKALFQASLSLVFNPEDGSPLQTLCDNVHAAYPGSTGAMIVLFDEAGRRHDATAGLLSADDQADLYRRSGSPDTDLVRKVTKHTGTPSTLGIPFEVAPDNAGVVLVQFPDERLFNEEEVEAFQMFVTQASLSYQNALQLDHLKRSQSAQHEISARRGRVAVSDSIVRQAAELFSADFVTFWPYDGKFIAKGRATVGLPVEALPQPREGRLTYTALDAGYLSIDDTDRDQQLQDDEREFLSTYGIRSLQAVRLQAEKPVGVLYVSFGRPRGFGDYSRQRLETFAAYAALALANAVAFDQLKSANATAAALAKLLPISDVLPFNRQLAESAAEVVRCDKVTIYAFNESTRAFLYPPATFGLDREDLVATAPRLPRYSMVRQMLDLEQPLVVDSVADHPRLRSAAFARRERISSCVVVPLLVRKDDGSPARRVGVMFVNYLEPQRFTQAEVDEIRFFADLAAIAISMSQINEERAEATLTATVEARKILMKSLAAASHTLRTPLHSLQLNVELLANGTYGTLEEKASNQIDRMFGMARTAGRITSNMLDIATLVEKGELKLQLSLSNIREVVRQAVEHLRDEAATKHVALSTRFLKGSSRVFPFDETKIYAVVGNLLANAIRAAENGVVEVQVSAEPGTATVTIVDNGSGVKDGLKLLEGYMCAGAHGVGIGLSISHQYVLLHNGRLGWSRQDERTSFWFTLPILPDALVVQ